MPQTTPQDSILAQLMLIKNDSSTLLKNIAPAFAFPTTITGVDKISIAEKIEVLKLRIVHIEKQLMKI